MRKTFSEFICQQCGYKNPSFLGRCPECGNWNSLVETPVEPKKTGSAKPREIVKPVKLKEVAAENFRRTSTGFGEFDRVLGGGIVPGSVILAAGEPGVGKSTLLLQVALNFASSAKNKVLYVAAEESANQIKLRAGRLAKKIPENLFILTQTDLENLISAVGDLAPKLLICDSVQAVSADYLSQPAGSVSQVKEVARVIADQVKVGETASFLVGHVTKEGAIAGPKVLEHLVDVVLYFEGDTNHNWRILQTTKNRFGAVSEVGVFEMNSAGLSEVVNPSKLFLAQRQANVAGSCVVPTLAGARCILAEIQALTSPTNMIQPRRVATGIDYGRLQMILAVVSRTLNLPLANFDVYVNVAGGLKISEPAADLAIALSLVSAFARKAVKENLAAIGEVGLLGEVRGVSNFEIRIKEAAKFGLNKVLAAPQVMRLAEAVKLALD